MSVEDTFGIMGFVEVASVLVEIHTDHRLSMLLTIFPVHIQMFSESGWQVSSDSVNLFSLTHPVPSHKVRTFD